MERSRLQQVLDEAVEAARSLTEGAPASYIPELATVDPEATSAAVMGIDGTTTLAGDAATHRFTLQSSAKLALLAGLLEERGPDAVFSVVGTEPTGGSFASVGELEWRGPRPGNPLINSGAIALCAQLEGDLERRLAWIEDWGTRLYGQRPVFHQRVWVSERRTGHKNRAIAHVLKAAGLLDGPVEDVLEAYFALCSLEAGVKEAARFAAVLASGGVAPGGERVLSPATAATVVALMATCGMYDESGAHLVRTGLPAKSGVSGVIVAVAPGIAGIAVSSPRINAKGGSVRGHAVLRGLSSALGWHFARPFGPPP
ncbi:MAG: glutaminase A [Alphaproteobacteria bacterium]|nr:glutaminase A [Alphaproteobacteria bacterium]